MKPILSKNNNKLSSKYISSLKKCLEDKKKAKSLQNLMEYYEFVQKLQKLTYFPSKFSIKKCTQMPYWAADATGVYIYNKLSSGETRKLKLGIALCKEKSNYNLACYQLDDKNNIVRAKDANGSLYVVLDHEMVICAEVGLFREFNKTSDPSAQGVTTVFATVFPLRIEIGQAILKNKSWKQPTVKFKGGFMEKSVIVDGDRLKPDINPVDAASYDNSKLNVSIYLSYVRIDPNNTQSGNGYGIGVVKSDLVREIVNDPVIPDSSEILPYALKPTTVFLETDIDIMKPEFYGVYQVSYLGNDKNMQIISNTEDGKVVFDDKLHIFFDPNPSGFSLS